MPKANQPTILFDNTALSDFRLRGPRYYYFRHELGWDTEGGRLAADWGTAWHEATATVTKVFGWPAETIKGYADELSWIAGSRFTEIWNKLQPEATVEVVKSDRELEEQLWDKSPLRARPMLVEYIKQRAEVWTRWELLGVETSFVVPILSDRPDVGLVGLIDRQIRVDNEIAPVEIKTTGNFNYSVKAGIRPQFFKQFEVGSQMPTYVYALRLLADDPLVRRAYIDASLRHRNKTESRSNIHVLHPMLFNDAQLDTWWRDTERTIYDILDNRERQKKGLYAWPRACGGHCMTYGACPYSDLCSSGQDLTTIQRPANLIERRWEPVIVKESPK